MNIIFMPTLNCNVECEYCFVKKEKSMLSLEQTKLIIEKIANYCKNNSIPEVRFFWQGGEAMLMGKDYYFELSNFFYSTFSKISVVYKNFLQTNLMAYNQSWNSIFEKFFERRISTSMDFPFDHRVIKKNQDSSYYFKLWVEKFERLRNFDFDINVISLISARTLNYSIDEYVDFYINKLKLKKWQINFPHLGNNEQYNRELISISNIKLGNFLCGVLSTLKKYPHIVVEPFESIKKKISHSKSALLPCIYSPSCANDFIAISSTGEVSNCDCLAGSQMLYFGNILTDSLETILNCNERKSLRNRLGLILKSECGACPYLSLCFGGCPVRADNDISKALKMKDRYCETYKIVFQFLLNQE